MYGYKLTKEDRIALRQWLAGLGSLAIIILGLVLWGVIIELFGVFTSMDQYSLFDGLRDFFWIHDVFFYDTWKVFDFLERLFDFLRGSVIS